MATPYVHIDPTQPVRVASKAGHIFQRMQQSRYCTAPPIPYEVANQQLDALLKVLFDKELGEESAKAIEVAAAVGQTVERYRTYVENICKEDIGIIEDSGFKAKGANLFALGRTGFSLTRAGLLMLVVGAGAATGYIV